MSNSMNLEQNLSQQLHVTPALRQSIDMLKYSWEELQQFLESQEAENPFIEIKWKTGEYAARTTRISSSADWDELNGIADDTVTIESLLLEQLRMRVTSPEIYRAAAYLAGNLDERGYLVVSLEEAGEELHLPPEIMQQSLQLLQSLDPPGVGARDLTECLLLQAEMDPSSHPLALKLITGHLHDLARGNLDVIRRSIGASRKSVEEAILYIKTLNPRPCSALQGTAAAPVTADVIVEYTPDTPQKFTIRDMYSPRISINADYIPAASDCSEEVRSYCKERIQSGKWLVQSVAYRRNTLLKVASVIAKEQVAFLSGQDHSLKPLNIKEIAGRTGLHESTISRTVRHKYMDTPRGLFEMKKLLSNTIATAEGETSTESVKQQIRNMIADEDKKSPLSDQRITNELQAQGIEISRRTVAKYRNEERILSASMRRLR
ncbi:RNA polymerase factor sigma-54 [Paenibacillus wulumuqiensis]|uniref:RNA polymerase factor sigma-54 n=1 Tax=Paenibacillus wulumuqiensis TaxID=1567107 RepID=UPI000698CBA7|nr:RNA polymerase factor sigma-54 [Paenibacillus wulumuqiensis]